MVTPGTISIIGGGFIQGRDFLPAKEIIDSLIEPRETMGQNPDNQVP